MAEDRLYHSVIAEAACKAGRFVVYGHTLKPFCLLHSIQLSQLGNPLWCAEGIAEPEDLMAAAAICTSHEPVLEFPLPAEANPVEQLEVWTAYMSTCAASPLLKDRMNQANYSEFGTPVEIMAATKLMRTLGIPERRAWRMPYGLVWWYVEAVNEQETGDSYVLTEAEIAFEKEFNSAENVAVREARDDAVRWIVSNITDAKERQQLLDLASAGELPANWKEAYDV